MKRRCRARSEAGMTLVEVLVTLTIMGLAIAGITSALDTAPSASAAHRRTVNADTIVRNYAEAIKQSVAAGRYIDCAGPGAYGKDNLVPPFSVPFGYSVDQSQPAYQQLSNLNVVVAVDKSSSIALAPGGHAVTDVKTAANAFLDGLKDTGAKAAIVSFGANDTKVLLSEQASVNAGPTSVTSGTNLNYLKGIVDATQSTGLVFGPSSSPYWWTNWEAGLIQAQAAFPASTKPLIVFDTDGDPNRWIKTDNTLGVPPWPNDRLISTPLQTDAQNGHRHDVGCLPHCVVGVDTVSVTRSPTSTGSPAPTNTPRCRSVGPSGRRSPEPIPTTALQGSRQSNGIALRVEDFATPVTCTAPDHRLVLGPRPVLHPGRHRDDDEARRRLLFRYPVPRLHSHPDARRRSARRRSTSPTASERPRSLRCPDHHYRPHDELARSRRWHQPPASLSFSTYGLDEEVQGHRRATDEPERTPTATPAC